MITNYHTHHQLCGHAVGNCEEYTIEAIKNNIIELGFSDHAPNKFINDKNVRMKPEDIDHYIEDIQNTQEKYKGKIKLYTGLEVEWYYNQTPYYDFLTSKTDYLILGIHYASVNKTFNDKVSGFGLSTKEQILAYRDHAIDGMRSGYFKMFAHPDLYLNGYLRWDETSKQVAQDIIRVAEETNTILEYNANGYRRPKKILDGEEFYGYPNTNFWNLVKDSKVEVMISSDCHTPIQLHDYAIYKAEEEVVKLGLNIRTYLFEK